MPYISHTSLKILGKKEFVYNVEMRDNYGNSTQGTLKVDRIKGGMILLTGVASGDKVKLNGSTSTVDSATLRELKISTASVWSNGTGAYVPDPGLVEAIDSAGSGLAPNGVSVLSNSVRENCFLKIAEDLAQIQLVLTGVWDTAVSARFYGKSF
jgi:hypothetical protein